MLKFGRASAALWLSLTALTAAPLMGQKPLDQKLLAPQSEVAPDPAIRYGTLSNGLRYAIMPNKMPAGAISVRLAMDVGSYDEADDERGYAHFIEHMVFRSTKQSPGGFADQRFAALGVQLGRDQNAATGLESTTYGIDLPQGGMEGVRIVLEWLRGAADGILFAGPGVDTERGVVMSELRSRNSPMAEAQREMARFQLPGARSPDREPGGTEATLRGATPERLKAFYERWYRPDNAVLVIVGDAPADELLKAAETAFGSWQAKGQPPVRPKPQPLAERSLAAWTRTDPTLSSAVTACRFGPPEPERLPEAERLRREIRSQLWSTIFNARLSHLTNASGSPLVAAGVQVNRDIPDARGTCLLTLPAGEKWREGLKAAQQELRRFIADGPTAQELDVGVTQLASSIGGQLYKAQTRPTPALAEAIAATAIDHRPFLHPSETLRLYQRLTAGVTAQDVKQAAAEDWSGTGPLLAMSGAAPASKEALLAAWRAGESAAPLAAYADLQQATWPYTSFGPPGRVVSREVFPREDYVRLKFANGTLLNFKHTDLEAGGVEVRVRFGNGERVLTNANRLPAAIAGGFFPSGGLGKITYEQIGQALANTTWRFDLSLESTSWVLSTSTLNNQVAQQMQLLAAYVTDPAFGRPIDDKMPSAIDMVYRSYRTDPTAVANEAIEKAVFPNQLSLPPREQVQAFDAAALRKLLKPVFDTSPMEVAMVGDISEADAIAAVANTFGALPARPALKQPTGPGPFRRFPAVVPGPQTGYHQGPADKAAALLIWPLYVASYERRKEEYSLNLLSAIYQTRLIQQIRAGLGKTYSPQVVNPMPDAADQGYLAASIETSPEDLDTVIAAARKIAGELASGSITQAEVDAARTPLVAARVQSQKLNEPWASILSLTNRYPVAMYELVRYDADMAAIGVDDVRKAAATWLKRQPLVGRALPQSQRGSR